MKTKTEYAIVIFAVISAIVGVINIILGQTDYNSIFVGLKNSYLYFTICFIMLGISKMIDLLHDIRNKNEK